MLVDYDKYEEQLELSRLTKFNPLKHPRNPLTGRFRDTGASTGITPMQSAHGDYFDELEPRQQLQALSTFPETTPEVFAEALAKSTGWKVDPPSFAYDSDLPRVARVFDKVLDEFPDIERTIDGLVTTTKSEYARMVLENAGKTDSVPGAIFEKMELNPDAPEGASFEETTRAISWDDHKSRAHLMLNDKQDLPNVGDNLMEKNRISAEAGWISPATKEWEGIVAHELGHLVQRLVAGRIKGSREQWAGMMHGFDISPRELAENVSRYAASDPVEAFAEMFAMRTIYPTRFRSTSTGQKFEKMIEAVKAKIDTMHMP